MHRHTMRDRTMHSMIPLCVHVCVCASIPARCAAGQQLPRLRQRAGLSEKEKKKVPRWHVLIMSLH